MRRALHQLVLAAYGSADLADALAMVASELVENAFRYGRTPRPDAVLRVYEEADAVVVSITNATSTSRERVADLARRIEALVGVRDAAEAFRQALRDHTDATAVGDDAPSTVSGLGLARIRYEGECALECDTSAEGQVTVRARCPLARFALARA